MSNDLNNKTREERYPVSMNVKVVGTRQFDSNEIELLRQTAYTMNVSLSGCLLMTHFELEAQTIWIQLDNSKDSIIECRITREVDSGLSCSICYGLQFLGVTTLSKFMNQAELSKLENCVL